MESEPKPEKSEDEKRAKPSRFIIITGKETSDIIVQLDILGEEEAGESYSIIKVVIDQQSDEKRWVVFLEHDSFRFRKPSL